MKVHLLLTLLLYGSIYQSFASDCDDEPKIATEFGRVTPLGSNFSPSTNPNEIRESDNVRTIRLLLAPIQRTRFHWSAVIRDAAERPLAALSSDQFSDSDPFWTARLSSNYLQIIVNSNAPADQPVLRAIEYVAMPRAAEHPYYSVQSSKPAWRSLYEMRDPKNPAGGGTTFFRRLGDSVGMLISHSGDRVSGYKSWVCSGFLVASRPRLLFVTSDHCGGPWDKMDRWTGQVCSNMLVDFSWDGDAVPREYKCRKVWRDQRHDLAVLQLRSNDTAPPDPLRLRSSDALEEEISILHHPAGLEKQISDHCGVLTKLDWAKTAANSQQDLVYRCDTEGGSSGAPVLDESGKVIGIHHLGFEKNKSGQCDRLNKAVRTKFLIEFLNSKHLHGFVVD